MKNYLSKIEKHIYKINFSKIQSYILRFRKKNPFSLIISSIILVFLLSLYFTIPTFYNYENFDEEIQKKVSKDETKNQKFVFQFIFERLNHSNNDLLHG